MWYKQQKIKEFALNLRLKIIQILTNDVQVLILYLNILISIYFIFLKYETIENHAPAFFTLNILAIGRTSILLLSVPEMTLLDISTALRQSEWFL